MKFLVTGGAGFIGSAVVRELILNTEHSVINADCLTYAGNTASLAGVWQHPRHIFCQINICDRQALSGLFAKHQPDAVIHLAAESHVDRSIECSAPFIESNIVGSHVLLEATRHYWQRLDSHTQERFRLIHVSTDEVYGDLGNSKALFDETSAYAPNSPYAASKAASDHLASAWQRSYGLPIIISHSSNNYGPYQFPEKLIPHTLLKAMHGQTLPIYGDGQHIRDWLHVEDHARALILLAQQGKPGEHYLIGDQNESSNLVLVESLCDLLENIAPEYKPPHLAHYKELITFVPDRPGHDRRYAVDATKIRQTLGWKANKSFERGLQETLQWYLKNSAWWRPLVSGDYKLQRQGIKY